MTRPLPFPSALRQAALLAALYAVAGSCLTLAGWILDVPSLSDWGHTGIAMQPNTAVGALLCSVSLLLAVFNRRWASDALALMACVIGLATLFEHATNINLRIDTLLMFGRTWGSGLTVSPGRMGLPGATSLVLLATGLWLLNRSDPKLKVAPIALSVVLITLFSFVGRIFGAAGLYTIPQLNAIALQTTTILFAIAMGLVAARPNEEPLRTLLEDSGAGMLARRALPLIFILPILLGYLRVVGQQRNYYDTATGTALLVVTLSVLTSGVLWWGAVVVKAREKALARANSQRQAADEARRISDARAISTLESIADGFVAFDRDWNYTYINAEAEKLLGRRRDDLLGRNVWSLFPEAVGTEVYQRLQRASAGEQTALFEEFNVTLGRWLSLRAYPTADGGASLIFRDISEQKLAQERAFKSEQQALTMIRCLPASAAFLVDRDLRYILADGEALTTAGFTSQDFIGKTVFDVAANDERQINYYRRALRGDPFIHEHDAHDRSYVTRGVPLKNESGEVYAVLAFSHDITERRSAERAIRESEVRYRAFITNSSEGIYRLEFDPPVDISLPVEEQVELAYARGRFAECNDVMARMYGLDDASQLIGKSLDFMLPRSNPESRAYIASIIAAGYKASDVESAERDFQGNLVYFSNSMDGIIEDGKLVRIWGTQRDITERKRWIAELQDGDKRKDQFLATLAHELRNPLAPIANGLEVLKRADVDPTLDEFVLAPMDRQVKHMVRLIDDLLDLSRITRNRLELRRQTVELGEIMRQAVEACQAMIDGAGLTLNVDWPESPVFLDADSVRMVQVFVNLLTNAGKYTEPGGQVHFTARAASGKATISVRDTGVGIPSGMLEKVFDMFTQVDRSLERAQGGLGIGLSLVKQLVEMHGGEVTAKSEGVGKGSEFTVTLPIIEVADKRKTVPSPSGNGHVERFQRVLIVDDNIDSAKSLAMLLKLSGFVVETAFDGKQAISQAESFRPELVLLDLGLPTLTGYEVCERLRLCDWAKDVPIVALTGWGQPEDRARSAAAGFDGHLVKPLDQEALKQLLGTLARREERASSRATD